MESEIIVHQDTTVNAGKLSFVLSLAGIVAILGAGAVYGSMNARLDRVEHEVETRAPASEVRQGFTQLDARLSRMEASLDRILTYAPPQRAP